MNAAVATIARAHVSDLAERVIEILKVARLPVHIEAELQEEVAKLLDAAGIIYAREVKVVGGRIHFLVGYAGRFVEKHPSVGLEIKIKGGKRAIHRQCAAYCGDPRIGHLVVLTGMALALPAEMTRTPVTVVNIGSAWL